MKNCYFITSLFLLVSCVHGTYYKDISDQELKSLQAGKTTRAEIVAKFGNPYMEMQMTTDGVHMPKHCGKNGTQVQMITYHMTTTNRSQNVVLYVRGDNDVYCGSNVTKSASFTN